MASSKGRSNGGATRLEEFWEEERQRYSHQPDAEEDENALLRKDTKPHGKTQTRTMGKFKS